MIRNFSYNYGSFTIFIFNDFSFRSYRHVKRAEAPQFAVLLVTRAMREAEHEEDQPARQRIAGTCDLCGDRSDQHGPREKGPGIAPGPLSCEA